MNINEEGANLHAGRKTVRETLDVSQRVLLMFRNTVKQLRSVTVADEELKKRLFQDEEKKENVQVQMLRMMMSKRKGGMETPRSVASEDESQKKRARGTDRPNEPKFPRKSRQLSKGKRRKRWKARKRIERESWKELLTNG